MRSKQVSKKRKEIYKEVLEFITTHFAYPPLQECYIDKFMTRTIIQSYFVNLDILENFSICGKTLITLLADMRWKNALVLKKPIYLNLVIVFYSNMLISSNIFNRIVTNVGGILIALDMEELNRILKTSNKGFYVYLSRHRIEQPWYSIVEAVRNICRRSNSSEVFCNASFKSQALSLQVRVLHSIL